MRKLFTTICTALVLSSGYSQELNCEVKVTCPQCGLVDPSVFRDLESAIREFMNARRWTSDNYEPHEKIKCQLVMTISKEVSIDRFEAQVNIVSSRPVFNSDYETTLFNHSDKQWEFQYTTSQPLEFNENANLSNLTSLLAFYAYIIIGLDYDTFEKYGGTPYYLKAQTIVNNNQNTQASGWKSYENLRNRYWLVDNLLNSKFASFRSAFYTYHLKALDEFYTNPVTASKTMLGCFNDIDKVNSDQPNSMILQVFFNSKSEELRDVVAGMAPSERTRSLNVLCRLDPANCESYRKS